MKDVLSPSPFHVKDQLVTGLGDTHFSCDLFCSHKHVRNHGPIILCEVINAPDMSLGKNKNVDGRLGILVFECDH